ncbi:MAG: hypothetical protein ACXW2N_18160 [Allosphingosinicella sp.]
MRMAFRILLWLVAGLAALFGSVLLMFGSGGGSGLTDAGVRVMWACLLGTPILVAMGWAVGRKRAGRHPDGPT